MFYAHFVLAKKGPLSRIWLAAHWDKKLTKAHVFETNLEQSVDGILQPKVKMALRTSGHLLLGVVRIYSRKARYLLADCNEAFVKIKMAFRPGMVDLPEDNREAAMNAITLPEVFHDFDTEMPDLNDVDIQAQFSMNQTRAEEITMREDYGNITLDTGDNGFGEVGGEPGSPEMMRDGSVIEPDFGPDTMSLAPETEGTRDFSMADNLSIADNQSIVAPSSMFGRDSTRTKTNRLDAPIQDDGFGGSMTTGSVMAGGLFEDGSLFEDVPPTMSPSDRMMMSERLAPESFIQEPFQSVRSPSSHGGSRPATPMDMSPPGSPTPSHHSLAPSLAPSLTPSLAPSLAPSHHSTASHAPSVAQSHASVRSSRSVAASSIAASADPAPLPDSGAVASAQDTTTLLHNEEESFALAPVDASAIKGFTRAKRKRKLIVDETKAITGEEMKGQLSDTSDIVTTLDLAPPTKRLMHWKETGGVEKLFALPGRTLQSAIIFKKYQKNLTVKHAPDELFDSLPGSHDTEELSFEKERAAPKEFQEPLPPTPKRESRGRKRKSPDYESEYLRHQEELIRATEESAREERERHQKRLAEEEAAAAAAAESPEKATADLTAAPGDLTADETAESTADEAAPPPQLETTDNTNMLQTPGGIHEEAVAPSPSPLHSTHSPPQDDYDGGSPSHHEEEEVSPRRVPGRPVYPPGTPVHNYTTPLHDPSYQEPFPTPPNALPQADFTDQWVSQAATATATGTAIPPPQTPTHSMYGDDHHNDDDDHHHEDFEDFPAEVEGEEDPEMLEDETIENFEDRVLNKRAAQLHRNLGRRWEGEATPLPLTGLLRKNNRKQAAQKFYSLLVLQKVMAVEVDQTAIFGEMLITQGRDFAKPDLKL